MSVLVKGMEMPGTCYKCKFALARFDPLPTQKYKRHDFECVLTEKTLTSTKRNRACPLVPVPTPHGRLIDASTKVTAKYYVDADGKETEQRTTTLDEMLTGICELPPTIIEAEVEE